jgi:hypothetical protein
LGTLSECKNDLSPGLTKSITLDSVIYYLEALIQNIYQKDPLHMKELVIDFLQTDMPKLRRKLTERLSLLKYLCESLKYKQFTEIDQ